MGPGTQRIVEPRRRSEKPFPGKSTDPAGGSLPRPAARKGSVPWGYQVKDEPGAMLKTFRPVQTSKVPTMVTLAEMFLNSPVPLSMFMIS